MHMGSLYRYIHMGRPICVWVIYAYGLEQGHHRTFDEVLWSQTFDNSTAIQSRCCQQEESIAKYVAEL